MSGYIGPVPVPQSIQRRQSFTATAGQTTFGTTGYTDGDFIDVYLNGVKLVGGTDYTATNGSDIVLTSAASASDVLDFVTFNSLSLVNHTFDNSITLQNATEEDTDGGRETTIIFKGEQSGGEISTLAEIEASHDGTADDEKGDLIFRTNDGSDGSSPTEVARIDSGGNLLVGTTSTNIVASSISTDEGFVYVNGSALTAARNAGQVADFNRITNNGEIIRLRKDGTTVGSIGTGATGGTLFLDGSASGVGLQLGASNIYPRDAGSLSDGGVDLGQTNYRFKDLYLSGGIYLGGTGSANKLDDYEEGTFTPVLKFNDSDAGVTYANRDGLYTKVGRLVTCIIRMGLSNNGTGTGNAVIHGLPFTVSEVMSTTAVQGGAAITFVSGTSGTSYALHLHPWEGTTTARIYRISSTSGKSNDEATDSHLTNSFDCRVTFTYIT
mgnify:FL=1